MTLKSPMTYIRYCANHPEEFKDEPPLGACGTIDIDDCTLSGESTADEMNRSADYRRKRWEDYHKAKAQDLGYEIDVELLHRHFPLGGSNFDIIV